MRNSKKGLLIKRRSSEWNFSSTSQASFYNSSRARVAKWTALMTHAENIWKSCKMWSEIRGNFRWFRCYESSTSDSAWIISETHLIAWGLSLVENWNFFFRLFFPALMCRNRFSFKSSFKILLLTFAPQRHQQTIKFVFFTFRCNQKQATETKRLRILFLCLFLPSNFAIENSSNSMNFLFFKKSAKEQRTQI